jgi:hypothetical protein
MPGSTPAGGQMTPFERVGHQGRCYPWFLPASPAVRRVDIPASEAVPEEPAPATARTRLCVQEVRYSRQRRCSSCCSAKLFRHPTGKTDVALARGAGVLRSTLASPPARSHFGHANQACAARLLRARGAHSLVFERSAFCASPIQDSAIASRMSRCSSGIVFANCRHVSAYRL